MAKLVGIYPEKAGKSRLNAKQLLFSFDEARQMIVEFDEKDVSSIAIGSCCDCPNCSCLNCHCMEKNIALLEKPGDEEQFSLNQDEIKALLTETVSCISCRKSAEEMLLLAAESNSLALDPFYTSSCCCVSVDRRYQQSPGYSRRIHHLLHCLAERVLQQIEANRCRRSYQPSRCPFHSLDSQRPKTSTAWLDLWSSLNEECRKEVLIMNSDGLLATVNGFLRRNKFCSACRSRVLSAYEILVGREEGSSVHGYCSKLFEKFRACSSSNHVHLPSEVDYISNLIARAEPDLAGNKGERHANTIEAAQEEVLTCVGIYLIDRFHRLSVRLRTERNTWNVLIYTILLGLKRKVESIAARRYGSDYIDALCADLEVQRPIVKKKKKSKKANKKPREKQPNIPSPAALSDDDEVQASDSDSEHTANSGISCCPKGCKCCSDKLMISPLSPPVTDDDLTVANNSSFESPIRVDSDESGRASSPALTSSANSTRARKVHDFDNPQLLTSCICEDDLDEKAEDSEIISEEELRIYDLGELQKQRVVERQRVREKFFSRLATLAASKVLKN